MPLWKPKTSRYFHARFALDGVVYQGTTGCTSRRKAERFLQDWRERIVAERAGIAPKPRAVLSLDEAAGRWWQERGQHRKSSRDAARGLTRLIAFLGADTPLGRIEDADLASYVACRRAGVSPATVNREIELLRAVLHYARRAWKADVPELDFGAHLLEEPAERVRELSADEEARLWPALRPDYHPLIRFCLWTGVRKSDALTLTWRQVDHGAGLIRFKSKSRKPGGAPHILPMTPAVAELLRALRGHHESRVFTYVARRAGNRRPVTVSGLRKVWEGALRLSGIEDFRFHDTRHTAGTRILRATGNLKAVQRVLGHTDIATTTRYAHAADSDVRAALDAGQRLTIVSPAPADETKAL